MNNVRHSEVMSDTFLMVDIYMLMQIMQRNEQPTLDIDVHS